MHNERQLDSIDERYSKTYGSDAGEDIREGYEPTDDADVVDPKTDEIAEQASRHGADGNHSSDHNSEESRQWKEELEPSVKIVPKYGVPGEEFENVWGKGQPPKENP